MKLFNAGSLFPAADALGPVWPINKPVVLTTEDGVTATLMNGSIGGVLAPGAAGGQLILRSPLLEASRPALGSPLDAGHHPFWLQPTHGSLWPSEVLHIEGTAWAVTTWNTFYGTVRVFDVLRSHAGGWTLFRYIEGSTAMTVDLSCAPRLGARARWKLSADRATAVMSGDGVTVELATTLSDLCVLRAEAFTSGVVDRQGAFAMLRASTTKTLASPLTLEAAATLAEEILEEAGSWLEPEPEPSLLALAAGAALKVGRRHGGWIASPVATTWWSAVDRLRLATGHDLRMAKRSAKVGVVSAAVFGASAMALYGTPTSALLMVIAFACMVWSSGRAVAVSEHSPDPRDAARAQLAWSIAVAAAAVITVAVLGAHISRTSSPFEFAFSGPSLLVALLAAISATRLALYAKAAIHGLTSA